MEETNYIVEISKQLKRIADALEVISISEIYKMPVPDVYSLGLLTASEYSAYKNRLPHYKGNWWLDSKEKNSNEGIFVSTDYEVERVSSDVDWIYVRPCLRITNGAEFQYKQTIKYGKYTFAYIGDNLLLSTIGIKLISYEDLKKMKDWEWNNLVTGKWDWMYNQEATPLKLSVEAVSDIRLLSGEEFERLRENIPIIEDDWWLRECGKDGYPAKVTDGTVIVRKINDCTKKYGVRPVLVVDAGKYELKKRDKVCINGILYTYIGENYLITNNIIGLCMYDRNGDKWDNSEIKNWLITKGAKLLLENKHE